MLSPKKFQTLIWTHYHHHRRDFPWRHTQDAYKIVVSEIMLQQTQAGRVVAKYNEFVKALPNFQALAKAPLSKVLTLWQGLGYNRRALALKKLAEEVTEKYRGKLPQSPELLVTLPGIGRATASSIAAFAFNLPTVFIETNIRTVYLHHFFADQTGVNDKELLPFIAKTLDSKNPREWYFALMDYGVYLKTTLPNPSRRSKHHSKQAKFKGSRELRGKILKLLVTNPKGLTISELKNNTTTDIEKALAELTKEALITKRGSRYRIA